ncbi:ead/Ea22-like family protein [Shigella sonnei]|nr:ead/Ea22-like family protein [Shigella sonnei]
MSKINYQALREAAEKATPDEWVAFISSGTGTYAVHTPGDKRCEDVIKWTGFDGQNNAENNARYIAAFNPEVVQALLDERERNQQYIKRRDQENEDIALTVGKLRVELEAEEKTSAARLEALDRTHKMFQREQCRAEAAEKRIAELEKSEEQLINERDHAESALADMYFAATGDRPEWSNWFGFSDAVDAVVDRIADLEAKQPSPVVPEEKPIPNPLSMYAVDAVAAIAEVRGWNACRAAMLHSAEPASNHEELPLDYLQGQKDGLEWAAQLAEANHPQTGDWLYDDPLELAKAIRKGPDMPEFDGPTPVTPDGWISCSERMPNDKQYVWCWGKSYGWTECDTFEGYYDWSRNKWWAVTDDGEEPASKVTHWMPLPEPPQEVK